MDIALLNDEGIVDNVIIVADDFEYDGVTTFPIVDGIPGPGWSRVDGQWVEPPAPDAPDPTLTLEEQLLQMEQSLAQQRAELDALIEIMLGGM